MSTALVTVPSAHVALEPTSIDDALKLAQKLVASGFLPKAIQKPESALAIILTGRELGLTVMQSLRSIHIIEGKPTLSADLMVGLVKRSPKCKFFRLVESSTRIASYTTYREGEGETSMSFTIEDAQAAGVTNKDNWRKYPAAMLRARCIAALARAVYPDVLAGVYEESELEVTPAAVADPVAVAAEPIKPAHPRTGAPMNPGWNAAADESIADAEFEEPEAPVESHEMLEDQIIDAWKERINVCNTNADLTKIAGELQREAKLFSDTVRYAVSAIYNQRKREVAEGIKAAKEAKEAAKPKARVYTMPSAPAREPGSDDVG